MAYPLSSLIKSRLVVQDRYKYQNGAMILLRPKRPHSPLIQVRLCQGGNFIFSVYRQDKRTEQFGSTEVIHLIVIRPLTQFQGLFLLWIFGGFLFSVYLILTATNFWKWNETADSAEKVAPHHFTLYHT